MKKAQRIIAVILTVLLLVSSGVPGMASVSAVEVKGTEAATEQTTEQATERTELKTARTVEPETLSQQAKSGSVGETEQESETKQTETQKATESETPETKKAQSVETEKKETDAPETQATEKATKAAGVSISSADDPELAALIPDKNFRKAVYDSLVAYNWIAGDSENPPKSVQEILETYQGPINASRKQIESIEGIQYFKIATTNDDYNYVINLADNNITDIMPIVKLCTDSDYYYGGYLECDNVQDADGNYVRGYAWRTVRVNLVGNPITCFPDPNNSRKAGWITWLPISTNNKSVVDSSKLQYYYLRNKREVYSGKIRVGYCKYESMDSDNYLKLTRLEVNGQVVENKVETKGATSKVVDGVVWNLDNDEYVSFSNLAKSGTVKLGLSADRSLKFEIRTDGGQVTDWTSYTYLLNPKINIYDHVIISDDQLGRARAYKFDDTSDDKKPLEGAWFSLYKKTENGEDELIEERLVTNTQGYTAYVEGLEPGEYYFVETQAPEGYIINDSEPYEFSIGHSVHIDGGVKSLNCSGVNTEEPIVATAGDKESFIITDMKDDIDFYLTDGKGERVGAEDESKIIQSVKTKYWSLDGAEEESVETYKSLTEAETKLNEYVRGNQITGEVEVEVEYKTDATVENENISIRGDSATVNVGDIPAVTVKADKTWLGIDADDVLPSVTYELYQAKSEKEGAEILINSHTISGVEKEDEGESADEPESMPETETESDDSTDPEIRYDYVFKTDQNGNLLPKYWKDGDGTYKPYIYTIKEKIAENDIIPPDGYVEEPSEPDDKNQITIKVTNIRKPSIVVKKSDLDDSERVDLSGVKFKLEKKQNDDTWVQVGDEAVTDKEGRVEFANLDWGTYRITETQTWDGYILLAEPINNIEITKPQMPSSYEKEFVYMVGNSKKYHVPKSGGIGSMWFLVIGGLLICIGGLWGYRRRFCRK